MDQLDEWIDKLEDVTDRLFIAGLDSTAEGSLERLRALKRPFQDAGLQYGYELITQLILLLERSRLSFEERTGTHEAFIRLQSFIDAARRIRQDNKLRNYYGVE